MAIALKCQLFRQVEARSFEAAERPSLSFTAFGSKRRCLNEGLGTTALQGPPFWPREISKGFLLIMLPKLFN